jgi:Ca2+-binding RTX toxin-like protein
MAESEFDPADVGPVADYDGVQYFLTFGRDGERFAIRADEISFDVAPGAEGPFLPLQFGGRMAPQVADFLVSAGTADAYGGVVVQAFKSVGGTQQMIEEHTLAAAQVAAFAIDDGRFSVTLDFGAMRSRYWEENSSGDLVPTGEVVWSETENGPVLDGGDGVRNPPIPDYAEVNAAAGPAEPEAQEAYIRLVPAGATPAADELWIPVSSYQFAADGSDGTLDLESLTVEVPAMGRLAGYFLSLAQGRTYQQAELVVTARESGTLHVVDRYTFGQAVITGMQSVRDDGAVADTFTIEYATLAMSLGTPDAAASWDTVHNTGSGGYAAGDGTGTGAVFEPIAYPRSDYTDARYFVTFRLNDSSAGFSFEATDINFGAGLTGSGPGGGHFSYDTLVFTHDFSKEVVTLEGWLVSGRMLDEVVIQAFRPNAADPTQMQLVEERDLGSVFISNINSRDEDLTTTLTFGNMGSVWRAGPGTGLLPESGDAFWDQIAQQGEASYDGDGPTWQEIQQQRETPVQFSDTFVCFRDGQGAVTDGEVPDNARSDSASAFQVLTCDFGLNMPVVFDRSGAGTGKAVLNDFHFTVAATGEIGAWLQNMLLTGELVPAVRFGFRDGTHLSRTEIDLRNAFVSGLAHRVDDNGQAVFDIALTYNQIRVRNFDSEDPDALPAKEMSWNAIRDDDQFDEVPDPEQSAAPQAQGSPPEHNSSAMAAAAANSDSHVIVTFVDDGRPVSEGFSIEVSDLVLGFSSQHPTGGTTSESDPAEAAPLLFSSELSPLLAGIFRHAAQQDGFDSIVVQRFREDGSGQMALVESHHLDGASVGEIDFDGAIARVALDYSAILSKWYTLAEGEYTLARTVAWDFESNNPGYSGQTEEPTWEQVQDAVSGTPEPGQQAYIRFFDGDATIDHEWIALSAYSFGIESDAAASSFEDLVITIAPDGQAAALMRALVVDQRIEKAELVVTGPGTSGEDHVIRSLIFANISVSSFGAGRSAGATSDQISLHFENLVIDGLSIGPDQPGIARDDAFATAEDAAVTGHNVFADNGSGADSDPDSPLMVVSVNGDAAAVGQTIVLASGAHLTLNADGTFVYDPHGVFDALPAAGSGASNLTGTDSFNYQIAGGDNAVVTITLSGVDSDDNLEGTLNADVLDGGIGDDFIQGFTGDDLLMGRAGADTMLGNAGNDTLRGGQGDDSLTGGLNDDVLDGGAGADAMDGGNGNDTFYVDDALDTIADNGGFDVVLARASYDLADGVEIERLRAEAGNAGIELGGNDRDDMIIGGAGDDTLRGEAGGDRLRGGDGADRIVGGAGRDAMSGEGGADIFVFGSTTDLGVGGETRDVIRDFEDGVDRIDLSGFQGFNFVYVSDFSLAGSEIRARIVGDRTLIEFNTDHDRGAEFQVALVGVHNITADDFLL